MVKSTTTETVPSWVIESASKVTEILWMATVKSHENICCYLINGFCTVVIRIRIVLIKTHFVALCTFDPPPETPTGFWSRPVSVGTNIEVEALLVSGRRGLLAWIRHWVGLGLKKFTSPRQVIRLLWWPSLGLFCLCVCRSACKQIFKKYTSDLHQVF